MDKPSAYIITEFDREMCRAMRRAVERLLKPLAAHGVEVSLNGGSFGEHHYHLKLTFSTLDEQGEPQREEADNFDILAGRFGLKPDDFHRNFYWKDVEYKLVGIKPRRPRYPIVAYRVHDGRPFKFSASLVQRALASPEGERPTMLDDDDFLGTA